MKNKAWFTALIVVVLLGIFFEAAFIGYRNNEPASTSLTITVLDRYMENENNITVYVSVGNETYDSTMSNFTVTFRDVTPPVKVSFQISGSIGFEKSVTLQTGNDPDTAYRVSSLTWSVDYRYEYRSVSA